jgi:hypothetical protein
MKLVNLALGAALLALTVASPANAYRPEYLVVQWATRDCHVFHNDTNGPIGTGWRVVAFANSAPEAFAKMQRLYAVRRCV